MKIQKCKFCYKKPKIEINRSKTITRVNHKCNKIDINHIYVSKKYAIKDWNNKFGTTLSLNKD